MCKFAKFLESLDLVLGELAENQSPSAESSHQYDAQEFWKQADGAVKVVAHEATKLCIAFSSPPVPAEKDLDPLLSRLEKGTIALVCAFYSLPKTQGLTLQQSFRGNVVGILTAVRKLVHVIQTQGVEGSKQQKQSTGNVWECCDDFPNWPKDNKQTVLNQSHSALGLANDALQELQEAQKEDDEDDVADTLDGMDLSGEGDVLDLGPCGSSTWTDSDRALIGPATGLAKAAKSCLKKVCITIKNQGDISITEHVSEFDVLSAVLSPVNEALDDHVSSLYPPVNHNDVRQNAEQLSTVLKQVLETTSQSHITGDADSAWLDFLTKAIQHNLDKICQLVQV